MNCRNFKIKILEVGDLLALFQQFVLRFVESRYGVLHDATLADCDRSSANTHAETFFRVFLLYQSTVYECGLFKET